MAPPPVPANFQTDARVHFDKSAGKWRYEDEEDGQEYEYTGSVWAPVVSTTCGAC
jgi:HIV Tat-specific factor 1